jgi:hypothetical protein
VVKAMKRPWGFVRAAGLLGALLTTRCELVGTGGRALLAECQFNDECTTPLLCAARQCRAQCRTDRDCVNGWRCRSAGQADKYVCYEPGVQENACVFPSDCAQSFVCANRVCARQCRSDYDCRLVDLTARCVTELGVCSNHPHLTDAGTLRDVARNDDDLDAGARQ